MRTSHSRLALLSLACLALSCATIAADGQGDVDLPSALTGPFRPLTREKSCDGDVCTGIDELPPGTPKGQPLYPRAPSSRNPTVLVRGSGVGDDLRVVLYVARDLDDQIDRIARFEASDARTFTDAVDVLTADQPFEGESIGDPAAIEVGGAVWLYYTIHRRTDRPGQIAGIARAVSTDGLAGRAFAKDAAPVLTLDGPKGAWERDAPRAPSVVRDDAGTFHLFYATDGAIGEATSADGVHFTRVDGYPQTAELDPVLGPSPTVDPATLTEGVKLPFDDLGIDDPYVVRETTALDRIVYRLFYTGRDRRDGSAVGLAGRYGDAPGPFDRASGFVFGGRQNPHTNAPAVARFPSFTLMYANVDDQTKGQDLGIGIAPAKMKLPIPETPASP
jgi:hypothetical protein